MAIFFHQYSHFLLCLLGGGLYALGFSSKVIPPLPITPLVGVALFLYTLAPAGRERSFKHQVGLLLAFSLGLYLFGYYWISFTLREFGQVPPPLNHVIGICLSPFLMPHYWSYLFLRKFALTLAKKFPRFFSPVLRGGSRAWMPLNATCLVLLESFIPQQFPASLGYSWLPLAPYLALAPVFGVHLYSFMSYYGAQVLGQMAFLGRGRGDLLFFSLFSLFVAGNFISPLSRGKAAPPCS